MPTHLVQRGITRYDKDHNISNGYMVRVTRDGTTHSQFFSDNKCGGKRKALQAARVAYEDLVASLPSIRTTRNVKTDRNQSGKVGVHLAETVSGYGETYSAYCASWKTADGRRAKISFAIKKYGKRAAFQLACLARDLETVDRDKVEARFQQTTGKSAARIAARPEKQATKAGRTAAAKPKPAGRGKARGTPAATGHSARKKVPSKPAGNGKPRSNRGAVRARAGK